MGVQESELITYVENCRKSQEPAQLLLAGRPPHYLETNVVAVTRQAGKVYLVAPDRLIPIDSVIGFPQPGL